MPIADLNGTPLAYDEAGAGPAVVLLHAGIADRRMWAPVAAPLAENHRVVRYDLRGYGESGLSADEFAHHDDLAALLDHLGIAQAVLVGCSLGGKVAVDAALAHPDRVAGLALFGAPVSGHSWSDELEDLWEATVGEVDERDRMALAAAEVRFWVVGPDRRPEDIDPALLTLAHEMDLHALACEERLAEVPVRELDPPAADRLAEIAVPVLATTGALDIPDVRHLADRLAAEIPDGRRFPDIPGTGHLAPLECPGPVTAALRDFLAEVTTRA